MMNLRTVYKEQAGGSVPPSGNITSVSDGTNTTTYAYDASNRLWRENNQEAGLTWTWEYDTAGNILNKKEYAYTTASGVTADTRFYYTYGENTVWGDLLTTYNGNTITYDGMGNPLNDGTYTYEWTQRRQLSRMNSTVFGFTIQKRLSGWRAAFAILRGKRKDQSP